MDTQGGAAETSDDDVLDWLRLSLVRGLGPRERGFLRRAFATPREIFRRSVEDLSSEVERALALDPDREDIRLPGAADLLAPRAEQEALAELERSRAHGLGLSCPASASFPELLRHVDDPPLVLSVRGSRETIPEASVAVVGSRRAQAFELRLAFELGRALAAHGVVVVSGLARGIDRAAHEGALSVPEGRTVAVLGCGLARVYPTEHGELAARICERGSLLSEHPVDAPPRKFHFPRRNRIVSGIAKATIVIAADESSGALITARHALDQGREVYTIPGRLDDPLARGTNGLLKEGNAHLIEGPDDVLIPLGWKDPPPNKDLRPPLVTHKARPALRGLPGEIEALLAAGAARPFEDLLAKSHVDARALLVALGRLQGLGRVRERGGLYELTW
jgi:DNA processing protein